MKLLLFLFLLMIPCISYSQYDYSIIDKIKDVDPELAEDFKTLLDSAYAHFSRKYDTLNLPPGFKEKKIQELAYQHMIVYAKINSDYLRRVMNRLPVHQTQGEYVDSMMVVMNMERLRFFDDYSRKRAERVKRQFKPRN